MPVRFSYQNFLPQDTITITSRSLYEAAFRYGQKTGSLTRAVLREKLQTHGSPDKQREIKMLLRRARSLAGDRTFTMDGKNELSRYLEMLTGFARGSRISLVDTIFLQSFADISCQTLVVIDQKQNALNVIHIEENQEDAHLVALNKLLEKRRTVGQEASVFSDKKNLGVAYRYRLNRWKTGESDYEFFAYPGLVGPGPAFGINHTTHTLVMADTLNASAEIQGSSLWANAIAFMLADIGDVSHAKAFFGKLRGSGLSVLGGYAMHMVQYGSTSKHFFCEFSGRQMTTNAPSRIDSRVCFTQTNYPRSPSLQKKDLYNNLRIASLNHKQAAIMVKRRSRQLVRIAKDAVFPTRKPERDIQRLLKLIASPDGDIETFENGPVLAGFPNPYEVAYLVASISGNDGKILMGKLTPPPVAGNEYRLFYTQQECKKNQSRNLLSLTIDAIVSRKLPLHVTVVYSTPTRRAKDWGLTESDEDTAYVAGKVAEALRSKNIETTLVDLHEDSLDRIDTLKTDCVFNLVEWTGQDMELSRKAFDHLRNLRVPVTGATEKNFCETSDKLMMKKLFDTYGIATPPWQEFQTGNERVLSHLLFPVIVKPAYEHGSIGLTRASIARTPGQLRRVAQKQIKTHTQPALAETFIHGRELLVYMLERKGAPVVLPIEEILFSRNEEFPFQTYECKWDKKHKDYDSTKVTIAALSPNERRAVEAVSRQAFKKMGFRGYARMDIRLKDGIAYMLEANSNPNVYDSDDDQIPGIAFPDFAWEVVASALREYKNGWKI